DTLALCAAVGLNQASVGAVTIRPGQGITGRAAADGVSIAAPDAHLHEAFLSHHGIGDNVYTSQVSVPMLLRGPTRLVGVLNILTIARRSFDEDEMQFFQTVAGELAISIENARRYSWTDESLHRKVTELGTLQRVSRIVASTLDLASVLRLITEQAVELIHAEAAAVFRLPTHLNAPTAALVPIVEHQKGRSRELTDPASRDRVVAEVLRSGTACADDITFVDGPRRLFCLPLNSARENLGALCFRFRIGTELNEDELGLLQAFSDSAALAIENAQLYQDARDALETQSALLQEMHHRVRNNLQTVAALLSLQLRSAGDAPWAGEIRQAVNRIQSIASVHDLLSDERRLGGTTVDVIARHVAEDAHSTLIPPGLTVEFAIEPTDLVVPSKQATSLALLINELVSNAISHGFRERSHGNIWMRAWRSKSNACIEVKNDGQPVPEDFVPAEGRGLGMRIIQRLVTSDLRGEFSIRSTDEGTVALIQFPLALPDAATE
ncbi:MAG: GAF domain-containing protein, partial [Chloroflexota bacterium]|nr:GAF domain-containing protein [Chloroflexota bacterium]